MTKSLLTISIFILLASCGNPQTANEEDLQNRKKKIEEMEKAELKSDQIERKNRSIKFCKSKGVPTIEHLPAIESIEEVEIRSKEEIINRALVLSYLGLKSEGLEEKHLKEFEQKYSIGAHFSPEELDYKEAQLPTQQQKVNANWRYESLHVMLWALGYIDTLSFPSELCVVAEDVKLIFDKTREEFIAQAKLRSKEEILDQADLIYRINWACVDARVKGNNPPAELNPSVVYERHYSLNWLINYLDQEWDDVSTDT